MRGISLTSSSLSSINLGYPLKGKLAAVLQTSALGGPTLSTTIEAPVDIKHFSGAVAGEER